MADNVVDIFKKRQKELKDALAETETIKPKVPPKVPPKAAGLPETPAPPTIGGLKKQSEDKINEMRKKGWIK
jgi:hypothetical protein